jgi:hypothetical protein
VRPPRCFGAPVPVARVVDVLESGGALAPAARQPRARQTVVHPIIDIECLATVARPRTIKNIQFTAKWTPRVSRILAPVHPAPPRVLGRTTLSRLSSQEVIVTVVSRHNSNSLNIKLD